VRIFSQTYSQALLKLESVFQIRNFNKVLKVYGTSL